MSDHGCPSRSSLSSNNDMASRGHTGCIGVVSKRRAHEKSRYGCANCKFRHVKCDEKRPSCAKCRSFGVSCVYRNRISPETLTVKPAFSLDISSTKTTPQLNSSEAYQLSSEDSFLIERFQMDIVFTLGSYSSRQNFSEKTLPIALRSPLVMHMILALTQFYDATMLSSSTAGDDACQSYHWNRATYLLRTQLSQPVKPSERDALWIAVALHSVAYLAATDANTPHEAWPLRSPSCLDLAWLKLCDGKRLVSDLTDPIRSDGAFCVAAAELQTMVDFLLQKASHVPSRDSLPDGFYELYGLRKNSEGNPYRAGVATLSYLLSFELDERNFTPHLCWTCVLDKRFRHLLYQKDEKAVLLLLYWYAKICDRRIWWVWKQAWTEGLAICMFLEASWKDEPEMIKLLEWPRMMLTVAMNG